MLLFFSCLTGHANATSLEASDLNGGDQFIVHEHIPYGPNELNHLDIYIPKQAKNTELSTVVFFYGGCWGGCITTTKETYLFVAEALTAKGYIVVLTDYRLYPQVAFPEIIDDAKNTVEWVKSNIQNYAGNPESLFLMGYSAGAHLAAMLTLNEQYLTTSTYQSLKGFIGLAGPYDFLPLTRDYQKGVFAPPTKPADSQPLNFVNGTEPPLLLLQGNEDKVIAPRNIKNLASTVNLSGGKVTTHYYDGLNHIDILRALAVPESQKHTLLNDIVSFLDQEQEKSLPASNHVGFNKLDLPPNSLSAENPVLQKN